MPRISVANWLAHYRRAGFGRAYSFTNIIDTSVAAPNGTYLSFGEAAISGDKVAFTAAFRRRGGGNY